jgi:hypothetical protein
MTMSTLKAQSLRYFLRTAHIVALLQGKIAHFTFFVVVDDSLVPDGGFFSDGGIDYFSLALVVFELLRALRAREIVNVRFKLRLLTENKHFHLAIFERCRHAELQSKGRKRNALILPKANGI